MSGHSGKGALSCSEINFHLKMVIIKITQETGTHSVVKRAENIG